MKSPRVIQEHLDSKSYRDDNGCIINPSCINPEHLFAGTSKDNWDDMVRKGRAHYRQTPLTHCYRGHEFTPENTRIQPNGRVCQACRQIRQELYRKRLYDERTRKVAVLQRAIDGCGLPVNGGNCGPEDGLCSECVNDLVAGAKEVLNRKACIDPSRTEE